MEIVEHGAACETARLKAAVHRLRDYGISVAVDDLGTTIVVVALGATLLYPSDQPLNYPQSSTPIRNPSSMSVSRDRPRHITMFPGGESFARAR